MCISLSHQYYNGYNNDNHVAIIKAIFSGPPVSSSSCSPAFLSFQANFLKWSSIPVSVRFPSLAPFSAGTALLSTSDSLPARPLLCPCPLALVLLVIYSPLRPPFPVVFFQLLCSFLIHTPPRPHLNLSRVFSILRVDIPSWKITFTATASTTCYVQPRFLSSAPAWIFATS